MPTHGVIATWAQADFHLAAGVAQAGVFQHHAADLEGFAFQGQKVQAGDHDVAPEHFRPDGAAMQAGCHGCQVLSSAVIWSPGVSADAGYNGFLLRVTTKVMPIQKNPAVLFQCTLVRSFRVLTLLLLSLIAGCTNIAKDVSQTIHPTSSSVLSTSTLLSVGSEFFTGKGYQCVIRDDHSALRCTKELRDLYIHQTQAEVQIYPGDGNVYPHTLVTSRWDEGLIPGEFISSEFTNPDVKAFCEYLMAQSLGSCRAIL